MGAKQRFKESDVYRITTSDPFGYRSRKLAERARKGRRGLAIWFHCDFGWYIKRGNTAYGRGGETMPLKDIS